jgi:hypothetical protein
LPADVPSLREVQARFFGLITAPESVEKAMDAVGVTAAELEQVIASDARKSAVERLDIYANMYFFRIRDVLAELFPKLAAAAGEAAFHNLVTDYLVVHPSTHPSLRNVGRHLPAFLARERRRSFGTTGAFADIAALDWARLDLYDAADAEPLTMDRLRALPPEAFAGLLLRMIPAYRLITLRYPVDDLPPGPVLVWRQEGDVYHRVLETREAAALAQIGDDTRFGHLCDWLSRELPDENEAAQAAFQLLAQWATDEILRL